MFLHSRLGGRGRGRRLRGRGYHDCDQSSAGGPLALVGLCVVEARVGVVVLFVLDQASFVDVPLILLQVT
jgi:hypothetical protein